MRRKHAGFSLIEVLVSLVVLAVGLLSVAAMQMYAVRSNHSAHLRSIAVAQGNSMVDRLKSNLAGVKAGYYNAIAGIPADPGCTVCTSAQIAQQDANVWNTSNAALLPSGKGTVVLSSGRYVVTVYWDGARTGATGTACSGNEQVDLDCFVMEVQL